MSHLACLLVACLTISTFVSQVSGQNNEVLIDGRDPASLIAYASDHGKVVFVDVEGQPFDRAVRVTVNEPADPVWDVQVLTEGQTRDVKKGDVLIGSYYIRAEPVNGNTPEVLGYFQKAEGQYEQLAWLGSKPGAAWTKKTFKAVAESDYPAGQLNVSFHLGKTPQVVEIADVYVVRESDAVEPAEPMPEPQVNPIDPDLLELLGPKATLIIEGNRPANLAGPGSSPDASHALVEVAGQPFTQAARVVVRKATDDPWGAELTSPRNTAPIRKGDVLFGLIDVRAESDKESGGGQFTAWLQAPDNGWTDLRKLEGAPGAQWSRRFFAAEARRDFAVGEVNFVFHLGTIPQTFEAANVLVWNLGPDADIDALPRTRLTYEGQAPDAAWRAEAWERIDRYRKADLIVKVVDRDGRPVPGARVEINLDRHAYGFGTFVDNDSPVLQDTPDGEKYREILLRYFNRVTCPSYGAQTWGWPDSATRERYIRTIEWAIAQNLVTRAHPVVWSRFDWSPAAWSQLRDDPEALRAETLAYIERLMTRFESLGVYETDMVNEPTGFHEVNDAVGDPGLWAQWFETAKRFGPSVRLGINEHTILSAGGLNRAKQDAYAAVIEDLIERGAPLEGIGMQGHMGEDFTPPTRLIEVLDRFAVYGLPLYVTEFDINTEDELTQADYLRDFVLAVFSHPATESITLWGFWGGKIWIPRADLWREDWTPKPAADAWVELMTETLHTHETINTDDRGQATVRGFLGDYMIKATDPFGNQIEKRVVLDHSGRHVQLTLH